MPKKKSLKEKKKTEKKKKEIFKKSLDLHGFTNEFYQTNIWKKGYNSSKSLPENRSNGNTSSNSKIRKKKKIQERETTDQ